jgi:hypothetical protein
MAGAFSYTAALKYKYFYFTVAVCEENHVRDMVLCQANRHAFLNP